MVSALIVLGGFLSLCAMAYGAVSGMGQFGNPAPSPDDDKSPLWFFGVGFVLLVVFIVLGVTHG